MTWTNFWTVTAIVYIPYYALNIAYDLYMYSKNKKKEEQNIYDVQHLFEAEKPQIVKFEDYIPVAVKADAGFENQSSKVENQAVTTSEMMKLIKLKSKGSMSKAVDIFG